MRRSVITLLALVCLFATGCAGAPGFSPDSSASSSPVALKVGLGYIASVQFAPFYYAKQQGYYAGGGLDVTLENKTDPELITLLGQGALDVGIGDGTSVIPAAANGVPVRYIATIYAQFPNAVIARADSGIRAPGDLKGKTLGTPGKYGSSWVMLQALLRSAALTPDDLDIRLYPDFGQATALAQGAVQAATGFVNNEPVFLAAQAVQTNVLRVDKITPLPGPGLVTGVSTLNTRHEALRAFVAATLRAMQEIQADPQRGLDAAFAVAPELRSDPSGQRAILNATMAVWTSDYTLAHGLGVIDPNAWSASVAFMRTLPDSGVSNAIPIDQLISTDFVPAR